LPIRTSNAVVSLLNSLFDDPAEVASTPATVPVLLPVALDQTYDYLLPSGLELPAGSFILVPFGPQTRIGVVWDRPLGDSDKPVNPNKLKAVVDRIDVPPLPVLSMRFAEWIAKYTLAPMGMVLRMMMGAQSAFEPQKPRNGVRAAEGANEPPRMTPARLKAMQVASDGLIRAKSALAAEASVSIGVVDGLVQAGLLVEVQIPERTYRIPDPAHAATTFGEHQVPAVETLKSAVDGRNFSVTLLDGVTGSGKTEVYFEAVARTLAQGRQAVIMLPEIALTSQFMDRFERRFGHPPSSGNGWRPRRGRCPFGAFSPL
jgi:primosomal protein N' (replication factor Y) (superfamily II helicase)